MDGTNPILNELQGLSPGAQQALLQAHQSASAAPPMQPAKIAPPAQGLQAPSAPPPAMIGGSMTPPQHPSLGIPPAPPAQTANGLQTQKDESERSRLLDTGSGIQQIHNPVLRGLAGVGNAIGSVVAPGLTAQIPGTEEHHEVLLGRANKNLTGDLGIGQKEATEAETQARLPNLNATAAHEQQVTAGLPQEQADTHAKSEAETGNFNSESWQRMHPNDEWSPVAGAQGPNGEPLEHSKLTGTYRVAPGVTGAATESSTKPPETKSINVNGVPHVMGWNPQTKKFDVDQGLAGEKPPSVNVNAGDAAVDRLASRLGKPYQTGHDKASDQYDRVDEAMRMLASPGAEGKALALPKILTGLVSGQGTGVRITQPELNAIATARGVKGDVEGFFNSISGEGKLSADQVKELNGILSDVRQRLSDKDSIHSQALDKINGAATREDIQAADKEARKLLNDYEHAKKIGTMHDGTRVWSNDGVHMFSILTGQEVK